MGENLWGKLRPEWKVAGLEILTKEKLAQDKKDFVLRQEKKKEILANKPTKPVVAPVVAPVVEVKPEVVPAPTEEVKTEQVVADSSGSNP